MQYDTPTTSPPSVTAAPRAFIKRMADQVSSRVSAVRPRADEMYNSISSKIANNRVVQSVTEGVRTNYNFVIIGGLCIIIVILLMVSYPPIQRAWAELWGIAPVSPPSPPPPTKGKDGVKPPVATPAADTLPKWCLVSDLDNTRRCASVATAAQCQSNYVYPTKCECEKTN